MAEFNAGFKVYADSTAFEKGMAQVSKTSEDVGRRLTKNFDGRDAGRALATALGLSIDKIADKVARFWIGFHDEAQATLEALTISTGKAADAQEEALKRLREQKKRLAEESAKQSQDEELMVLKVIKEADEAKKKAWAEDLEFYKQTAREEKAATEEKKKQEEQNRINIRLTEHEAQLASEKADQEARAAAEISRQNKYRTAGIAGVGGVGQFGEASTGALNEKLSRDQRAIQGMGPFLNIGQQMEVARLQAEISNIKQELKFRDELASNIGLLGAEGARSAFKGDPLAYDRLVQQYVQDSRDAQKIAADSYELLRQMNERQKSGLPVVNLNL